MIIYEAINIKNGKRYIGQTKRDFEERKHEHIYDSQHGIRESHYFNRALKKHGVDAFVWKVIDMARTQDELNVKESFWIEFFDTTNNSNGYNSKGGGHNPFLTDEVKKKIGDAQRGPLNHMYGRLGGLNPSAKKVMIVSTSEIFDSVSDLVRTYPEFSDGHSKICAVCRGNRKTYKGQKFRYVDNDGNIIENGTDTTERFLICYNTGERFAKASFAFHKYKNNEEKCWLFYKCIKKGFGVWHGILFYYDDVDISNIDIDILINQAS